MRKSIWWLLLAVTVCGLFATGCSSEGSREFIPGKGWRKT